VPCVSLALDVALHLVLNGVARRVEFTS